MHVLAVLLLLLLTLTSAWAKSPLKALPPAPSPGGLCRTAIAAAERSWRLPAGLLPAIGRVESGRPDPQTGGVQSWPWTINAEGVGRFFETKDEAIAAVQALQARGVRSIDVGCMQVNLLHHPTAFATLDQAFDPGINAMYAGRFLSALFGQSASWPVAAAAYHSQTPDLAADYRRRVMTAWGRPDLLPVPPTEPQFAVYRDLLPDRLVYRAFAPSEQVYGAFTVRPAALAVSQRRGSASSPRAPSQRMANAR
jgi:Transglycosylase SLT domain